MPYRLRDSVSWVNVQGLGNEKTLRRIGEIFSIHPLALADAVNLPQRPKFETFELHHLLIAREAEFLPDGEIYCEQISLVFAPGYVVMFQEDPGDCFDPVRSRIRNGAPVRHNGADFLAYALLDCLIDNYFPILEVLGQRLEDLEDEVMAKPTKRTLGSIQLIRRQLLMLHRTAWQQRDATNAFMREEASHFTPSQRVYLRDAYDHAVQVIDTIETYREITVSLVDVYLSSINNRMGEVMKVLTVMTSIFIPLTFIAGVYGMNFEYMPELEEWWGYPAVLLLMAAVGVGLFVFFKRRGWIGREDSDLHPEIPAYVPEVPPDVHLGRMAAPGALTGGTGAAGGVGASSAASTTSAANTSVTSSPAANSSQAATAPQSATSSQPATSAQSAAASPASSSPATSSKGAR